MEKKIPKASKHNLHTKIKRQRTNSNELDEKEEINSNENNSNNNNNDIPKTPKKPTVNNSNNIATSIETPRTDRTLIDTQKLLYTTSRIPMTPSLKQNYIMKNCPMSARTCSRIPLLTLKNNYKKTNLFSIKLPQKRKLYFTDEEEDEEKREIFENFARKSKDLNEILQKFKKTSISDSLSNKDNNIDNNSNNSNNSNKTLTSSTISSNNSGIDNLQHSKGSSNSTVTNNSAISETTTKIKTNIKINNIKTNDESTPIQVKLEDQLKSINAMHSPTKSKISSRVMVSSQIPLQQEKENLSNNEINIRQETPMDIFQKISHHPLTINNTLINSNTATNNMNTTNTHNSTTFEIKSKILPSFSTTKGSLSQSIAKESGTFIPPKNPISVMENSISKSKFNTINSQSSSSVTTSQKKYKIESNTEKELNKNKQNNNKYKNNKDNDNDNNNYNNNNNNGNNNTNKNKTVIENLNNKSKNQNKMKGNEKESKRNNNNNNILFKEKDQLQHLIPLKPVKKEENAMEYFEKEKEKKNIQRQKQKQKQKQENSNNDNNKNNDSNKNNNNNFVTVATPVITRNASGEPVVEEYQYEKVNLAEPSALTININDPTIPGIGEIGDQSLSSIDGEEGGGVDSFLDDIIF